MRRLLAVLLIALALATAVVYAWAIMAPMTLSIGSGPIALVQNGAIAQSQVGVVTPTLPIASTAGTYLVIFIGNAATGTTSVITTAPAGFTRVKQATETSNSDLEVWVMPNNPGGILAATFGSSVAGTDWHAQMSEWRNVIASTALEASGTATAVGGTTLTPSTTTAVLNPTDVALAGWIQRIAGGVVTFTTPAGWTRLTDNGATSLTKHLDVEYRLNPPLGTLAPILTSDTTTNASASGLVIVLQAAPPVTDQTAMLAY